MIGGTGGHFCFAYNESGDQTASTCNRQGPAYDYDDQLTGTGGASFAYDAAGRRASRTAGGVTTSFLYDGEEVLLEQQGGTTTATYAYGNALTRKDGETPLFDGLGSARTLTGSGGAATAGAVTTAFGQPVAGYAGAYGFGATSGYRGDGDGDSYIIDSGGNEYGDGDGLLKVGCRYYDPATGSFLTRDTDLDQKPYAYCDADPVNKVDPSGHYGFFGGFRGMLAPVPEIAAGAIAGDVAVVGLTSGANLDYIQNDGNNFWGGIVGGGLGLGAGLGMATAGAGLLAGTGTAAALGGAVLLTGGAAAVVIGAVAIGYGISRSM